MVVAALQGGLCGVGDTIAVDAEPVRAMAERDPTFGLLLHKRFAAVIHHRLVSARVRALDLYGIGP